MKKNNPTITIVGAGNVGSQTAFYAALQNLGNIILIDVVEGLPQGKALDIQQSLSLTNSTSTILGTNKYEDTKDSNIIIITAGIARKPGMSREELYTINAGIIQTVLQNILSFSQNPIIIVVTNPLDAMVKLVYDISRLPKHRILGMAGTLDTARFKHFIAQELNCPAQQINTLVLGTHGDAMVPILSHTTFNNQPISQLLHPEKINEIVKRTQHGGAEIVNYLKTGSAFFAPALAIVELLHAIINDTKATLSCSVLLQGEYNVQDIFMGVPVQLGKEGIENIVQIELSPEEKIQLQHAAEHIKSITPVNSIKKQ